MREASRKTEGFLIGEWLATKSGVFSQSLINVLVFKVVNEEGSWAGAIRFTEAQGNPVMGIKVALNPEAAGQIGSAGSRN